MNHRIVSRVAAIAVFGVLAAAGNAQVYSSNPLAVISSNTTITDSITISDGPASITDLNVIVDITHSYDGDLDIILVPPSGNVYIHLTSDNGGAGDNMQFTRFDQQAAVSITTGVAPMNGNYRPEGGAIGWRVAATPLPGAELADLDALNGSDSNGTWQLWIDDDAAGDVGTLNYWSIELNNAIDSQGPVFTGGCCLSTGCQILASTDCEGQGGTFLGAYTNCGVYSYNIEVSSSAYSSIAAVGTQLANTNGDDAVALIDIGFPFNFMGTEYTQVNVSTNGNIQFPPNNSNDWTNDAIPNPAIPNNFIAPMWDDFDLDTTDGNGELYSYLDISGGDGNYSLTISWEGAEQYFNTNDSNDFQVVLFQNGDFEFRYGVITAEPTAGDYTIGYEDALGVTGQQVASADIGSGNTARRFVAVPPVNVCDGGSSCPACPADYDQDGGVTGSDVAAFFSDFEQGLPCGDTDQDGGITGSDVAIFFQFFEAGGC